MGDGKFAEANCFQTGSNTWQTYDSWPPKKAEQKNKAAKPADEEAKKDNE